MRSTTMWNGLLAAAFAATACTGPAGPAGPKGDPGPAGVAGHDGTDGTDGAKGTDGADGKDANRIPPRLLDEKIGGWTLENRNAINAMIAAKGIAAADFDAKRRPVAMFDWDNTVLKNDMGDATFFWMLKNSKILQPPARDWGVTSKALTAEAKTALNTACDGLAAPGEPLTTGTTAGAACADAMFAIYDGLKTPGGQDAWSPKLATTTTINFAYAWVAQLQAGWTPQQIREFARAAYRENADAPIGAKQTVGTKADVTGYVRIYEQIKDLVQTLERNEFDVYVITASPQYVIEEVAPDAGFDAGHVIGIRNVVGADGRLTYDLQGCGTVADKENTLITFDEGKRCWINKEVFGEPAGAAQLARNPDPTRRQVFAAGDSDTDIAFLKDATALKLVLNRNKLQVMCNAYSHLVRDGGKWLVQPMFIAPKAKKSSPYACDTATNNGGTVAIVDEDGQPMTPKEDIIYELPL